MADDTSVPDEGMPPAEGMMAPAPGEQAMGETPAPPVPPAPADQAQYAPPPPPPPAQPQYAPPPPYAAPPHGMPSRPGPATDSSKALAALGYLFPIIAIVMLFVEPYKDEKFVRFHSVQAVAIAVLYVIVGAISWVPVIGWLLWLVPVVIAIIGAIKAFQSEYWEIPLVYDAVKSFIEK